VLLVVKVKAARLTCQAGNEELEITDQLILSLGPRKSWKINANPVRFYPKKKMRYPIVQETERVSGSSWMGPENIAHTAV